MIGSIGIPSANTRGVYDTATPVPSMAQTIIGWFRPLTLTRVVKQVVDHEIKEVRTELRCLGMIQPFGPRELKIKPEGQRAWNWQMLHCTPEVALKDDEEFTVKGTRYRVMSQLAYQDYGYRQYELVQDYKGSNG